MCYYNTTLTSCENRCPSSKKKRKLVPDINTYGFVLVEILVYYTNEKTTYLKHPLIVTDRCILPNTWCP